MIRPEGFPKAHRLRKRREYVHVQTNGRKTTSRLFLALVLPREDDGPARLGITTTRRFGKAVRRNRLRRLVREAFRTRVLRVPDGVDVVIIPKKHADAASNPAIFADLQLLSEKIAAAHRRGESP